MSEIGKQIQTAGLYSIILVLLGCLLNLYGLAQPWNFQIPLQVWVGSVITGILCLWLGIGCSDNFAINGRQQTVYDALTQREKEVAAAVIAGKSNKEICSELFIENNTLKTHIRNIYKKANCNNRNEFKALFEQAGAVNNSNRYS